ncbi:hypothetical protein LJC58_10465 [Lachnospiraceae bacterium OttesenSCG-928-D06]|nr:hypothetical protein [Lachnospiraceae bacterium OttesenSCG-928-D06]
MDFNSDTYNKNGWVIKETDDADGITSYTFDTAGTVAAITETN